MKNKVLLLSVIVGFICAVIMSFFVHFPRAYADVSNPQYIGTLGTISSSTKAISGGSLLNFSNTHGVAPSGKYRFTKVTVMVHQDGGTTITGHAILYALTSQSYANGYLLISTQDVSSWGKALGGNLPYVDSQYKTVTATEQYGSQSITLVNLDTIVVNSGAAYESETPTTTTSGSQINATYQIQTSLPPVATSVSVGSSTITAGSAESISAHVEDDTYNTGYHRDAISVTDPNGTTHWIAANGSWTTDAANQEGSYYDHYNGGNTGGYTGSAPSLSNFSYTDTVSFPTTSTSPPGTYQVKVWMMDALKRPAQATVSTTFAVGAGGTSGGGGNPSITLTASPLSPKSGSSSQVSYSVTNWASGDYVTVTGTGGKDMWNTTDDTKASDSYSETENPSSGSSTTVNYTATVYNSSGVKQDSSTASVTWTSSVPKQPTTTSLQLAAKPKALGIGAATTLTVTVPPDPNGGGAPSGEFVQVYDQSTGQMVGMGAYTGAYPFTINSNQTETFSVTYTSNSAGSQTFIAKLWAPGVAPNTNSPILTSNTQTVTWEKPTVTITANPKQLLSGQTSKISYTAVGMQSGDYVTVVGSGGQNMWSAANDTKATDSYSETEYPATGGSTTVDYVAKMYNKLGTLLSTSTVKVLWGSPQISMSVSPSASTTTGSALTFSYTTKNMWSGDYVDVSNSGNGKYEWSATDDTKTSDSYSETESPTNGATTAVKYTAMMYDSSGQIVARATVSGTWTSVKPQITLSANPTHMYPGQSSNLSYYVNTTGTSGYTNVNQSIPNGDYVAITASGNGAHMWHTSKDVMIMDHDTETESPSAGQTISITYTATLYNSSGQVLGTSKVSVTWTNPWTGTISLSANPTVLGDGQPTTLAAHTSQAIPSGWSLTIWDTSTGQVVGTSGSAPETTQYSSYSAQTDQFVAKLTDGYQSIGTPSNTVSVTWSSLALSATPTQLPQGSSTTLEASGQNVPSGDYLVIYNNSTGQVVGYSQSTPYSINVQENSAQSDTFEAYISPNTSKSGALVNSNTVNVDWYGVSLTADPSRLPVGDTSTLTANAQNVPNGYVIDIEDTTTGKVVATGQAGQKTLQALQTKQQAETDDYVAQVVQPNNPPVPNMTVPATQQSQILGTGLNGVYKWTGSAWSLIWGFSNGAYNSEIVRNGNALYVNGWDGGGDIFESTNNGASWFNIANGSVTGADGGLGIMNGVLAAAGTGNYGQSLSTYSGGTWNTRKTQYFNIESAASNDTQLYLGVMDDYSYTEVVAANGQNIGNPMPSFYQSSNYFSEEINQLKFANNGTLYAAWEVVENFSPYNVISGVAKWTGGSSWQQILSNSTIANYEIGKVNGELWYTYGQSAYLYNGSSSTPSSIPYDSGIKPMLTISGGGSGNLEQYSPQWTFSEAPTSIPSSLFPKTAQVSSDGHGTMWVTGASLQPNGTAFFQSTFNLSNAQTVTFNNLWADDYAQVYVDGTPIMQYGNGGGVASSAPNTSSVSETLTAGQHQVVIEGTNNHAFSSKSANSAGVSLNVTANGQTLLTTSSPSQWTTTGTITQLPSGWFSGAVGTWHWTEYVMQENSGQPIYQQQSYTVQTTAQNVSAQTNPPVSVTWFNPITAPDNFTLAALPTHVVKPAQTMFKIGLDSTDQKFVDEALQGKAKLVIKCQQTWQSVVSANWVPDSNGLNVAIPYSPVPGTSLQYLAELVDPKTGNPVAISNEVTVTDTGNGKLGNSYTTETCSPNGNGTEIFNTYVNGKLVKTRTVPLTMKGLEISGVYNPPSALRNVFGLNGKVKLPITNSKVGYGPIPIRVQTPFAFAIDFPDAQPAAVTATFTVNQGYAVDSKGDTSWTVKMSPATNLGFGYWHGYTIMPKLPDGVNIRVSIKATDACGTNTTPTDTFPYDNMLTTEGRPEWYFDQPASPTPTNTPNN